MVKKSLTKRPLVKKTKKKIYRRAGVNTPSPIRTLKRTLKAIKIQRSQRKHTTRKPAYIARESEKFKSLINEGAAKYKKKIPTLHTRGLILKAIKLSAKPLQGIDLRGADLTEAQLNKIKLNDAKLNGVNFTKAELNQAILINADLTNANFDRTLLESVDFTGANLTRAKFKNTRLNKAIFKNANLTNANFDGTDLTNTDFTDADLTRAKFVNDMFRLTNFTGAELKEAILINADLTNVNFDNAGLERTNFTNATLKRAKFENAKLILTNFTGANLTEANLTEAILTNVNFDNANLNSTDFTGANLTRAKFSKNILISTNFTGANLTEAIFLNTTTSSANLPIFRNTNLTRATLDKLEYISKNNGNILTELTIKGSVRGEYDLRLEDMELRNSTLLDIRLTVSTLIGVNFSGSSMNNIIFDRCTINRCNFQDITSNSLKFNRCVIDNCNFAYAKLVGVEFTECQFTTPIWTNADLTNALFTSSPLRGLNFEEATLVNADFRFQNLSGTNFRNANLTQAHFNSLSVNGRTIPVQFDINTNFQGARLTSANFQSAIGLERHNFNGVIMNGAFFTACDLTGSTFIEADVRHVQFYYGNLTDCDFTNALVDNALYDGSTEGVVSTIGLVRAVGQESIPQEIHKAWSHVLKNATFIFLSNQVLTRTIKPTTAITMGRYINQTLQGLITDSRDIEQMKKVELTDQLNRCRASYESWDYMGILPGTNPPITYGDLAFATLEFVKSERNEFKNIYLEEVLGENVNAHGQGGMSCAKGMAERIVVKLIVPAQGMTTVAPERRFYYNQLINLVEPLYRLPEDEAAEIANAAYTDVDVEIGAALRDEWHDLHKVETAGAFPENTNLPTILANYRVFLLEKFRDVVMSPHKRLELNGNIERAIEDMKAAIEFDDTYFEGGSRRRKQRKRPLYTRIFSMTTREFRRLF